jgi:murein DD-endopeptidase MepM/ murein hydrolase activator NlpD
MDKTGGKILGRMGWILIGLLSIAIGAVGAISLACRRVETSPLATPMPARTVSQADDENPGAQFDKLNTLIRDGAIEREVARTRIIELLPRLREYFRAQGGITSAPDESVFPLAGYNHKAIGGINGSGYVAKGYNYFDGNKHGGHPAHDIFISDKNQDEMDDATGRPVDVVAMRSGVVVAAAKDWSPGSALRGGRYVYVFDPADASLIYYAHNREIFVKPGDIVTAGTLLATVGRSGKSAAEARSPTHLHVMRLIVEEGRPKPEDLYQVLLRARTVPRRKV